MKKYLLFILIPLLSCCSCYQQISRSTGVSEIQFGQGGGFTNQKITYRLTKNGKLYREEALLKVISCEEVERLFTKASRLDLSQSEHGNMYWFIEVKGKDHRKYVWASSSDIDRELRDLYTELNNTRL